MANTALAANTFNVPGLGYDLLMDKSGRVLQRDEKGNLSVIAYRGSNNQWNIVMSYPIQSDQIVDSLEERFKTIQR